MRDFKNMKRQRGRNRKPGGGGGGGGGGGHNPNRAFESNGPDGVKVRGNSQTVYERYQQLARDAFTSGDRVLAENYLQHAEHYFRLLRTLQPNRPVSEIAQRDALASGYDIDFEDESGEQARAQAEFEGMAEGGETEGGDQRDARDDNRREDRGERRDRPERDRGEREFRRDGDQPREPRGEFGRREREERAPREDRPREDRGERRVEGEPRPEGEGRREGRRERFRNRDDRRPRFAEGEGDTRPRDPLAVIEPEAAPLPRGDREADAGSPMLRAQDGAVSDMPAFLGRAAPTSAPDEAPAEAAPKRVRRPRKAAASAEPGEEQ